MNTLWGLSLSKVGILPHTFILGVTQERKLRAESCESIYQSLDRMSPWMDFVCSWGAPRETGPMFWTQSKIRDVPERCMVGTPANLPLKIRCLQYASWADDRWLSLSYLFAKQWRPEYSQAPMTFALMEHVNNVWSFSTAGRNKLTFFQGKITKDLILLRLGGSPGFPFQPSDTCDSAFSSLLHVVVVDCFVHPRRTGLKYSRTQMRTSSNSGNL